MPRGSKATGKMCISATRPTKSAKVTKKAALTFSELKKHPKKNKKPRRPPSAYDLFFRHERDDILRRSRTSAAASKVDGTADALLSEIIANNGRLDSSACCSDTNVDGASFLAKSSASHSSEPGFREISRVVSARWRSLDEPSRAIYDGLALLEKKRYDRKMQEWRRERSEEEHMQFEKLQMLADEDKDKCSIFFGTGEADAFSSLCSSPAEPDISLKVNDSLMSLENSNSTNASDEHMATSPLPFFGDSGSPSASSPSEHGVPKDLHQSGGVAETPPPRIKTSVEEGECNCDSSSQNGVFSALQRSIAQRKYELNTASCSHRFLPRLQPLPTPQPQPQPAAAKLTLERARHDVDSDDADHTLLGIEREYANVAVSFSATASTSVSASVDQPRSPNTTKAGAGGGCPSLQRLARLAADELETSLERGWPSLSHGHVNALLPPAGKQDCTGTSLAPPPSSVMPSCSVSTDSFGAGTNRSFSPLCDIDLDADVNGAGGIDGSRLMTMGLYSPTPIGAVSSVRKGVQNCGTTAEELDSESVDFLASVFCAGRYNT